MCPSSSWGKLNGKNWANIPLKRWPGLVTDSATITELKRAQLNQRDLPLSSVVPPLLTSWFHSFLYSCQFLDLQVALKAPLIHSLTNVLVHIFNYVWKVRHLENMLICPNVHEVFDLLTAPSQPITHFVGRLMANASWHLWVKVPDGVCVTDSTGLVTSRATVKVGGRVRRMIGEVTLGTKFLSGINIFALPWPSIMKSSPCMRSISLPLQVGRMLWYNINPVIIYPVTMYLKILLWEYRKIQGGKNATMSIWIWTKPMRYRCEKHHPELMVGAKLKSVVSVLTSWDVIHEFPDT